MKKPLFHQELLSLYLPAAPPKRELAISLNNYNHTPPIPTEPIQEPIHETISTEANSQNEGPAEREVKDVIETSIEGRVLQLVQEGKTVDEIAKLLNRGKTEVELLIKLNKQMNS